MGARGQLTRRISLIAVMALCATALATPLAAQRAESTTTTVAGDLPGGDMSSLAYAEAPQHAFDRTAPPLVGNNMDGPEALEAMGHLLDELAARNRMSVERLTHMLEDPYSRLDRDGMLFYVEPMTDDLEWDPGLAGPLSTPAPLDQTFNLHSRPGSNRVIYLDFDGHTVSNTAWNNATIPNGWQASPYNSQGDAGSFTATELTVIQMVWAMVAEDFAPFDVNVTTQDPGFDAINRSNSSDQTFGTRLVVTSSSSSGFCSGCGGVAYVGVFDRTSNHAYYQPAWCFSTSTSAKNIAECASHEIGHNLGLGHDGLLGGSAYYSGHAPWAPIMGVGYSQPVTQWSKGEYTNANNQQDDLHVMTQRGISVRPDDHTNNVNTATLIGSFQQGVISTSADFDAFRFLAPATGLVTFRATPAPVGPNLDILLRIYEVDQNGNPVLIAEANPPAQRVNASTASGLDAAVAMTVTAGRVYILQVSGTGHGTPTSGYSDYASLGQYTVTVEGMSGVLNGDSFGLVDSTTGRWYLFDATTWQTTSFYFGQPGDYPIMGDWNCDGIDTPGLYRRSTGLVYLRFSNSTGPADRQFMFGIPGDIPIAGDFNGDGCDTVSVYRPSAGRVFIINTLPSNGQAPVADLDYYFGIPGDKPFAGDFNGNGVDTVGLHRESTGFVYFRNSHTQGVADHSFFYGIPNDRMVTGSWASGGGSKPDTVAIFRPGNGTMYLRYSNSTGPADFTLKYGNSSMWPISGNFGALPGTGPIPPN